MFKHHSLLRFVITLLCLLGSNLVTAFTDTKSASDIRFTVYLDDDVFGTHRVRVAEQGSETVVVTTASFIYRLLFVQVYRYEHSTSETWRDGCVQSIESSTDDNGDELFIRGEFSAPSGQLNLETSKGKKQLVGCVHTFAYWDIEKLRSQQLLNTQTGDYESSALKSLGIQELKTPDRTIRANKFCLSADSGDIDLWYSDDNRWLALESQVKNGSTLRYLFEHLIGGDGAREDDE